MIISCRETFSTSFHVFAIDVFHNLKTTIRLCVYLCSLIFFSVFTSHTWRKPPENDRPSEEHTRQAPIRLVQKYKSVKVFSCHRPLQFHCSFVSLSRCQVFIRINGRVSFNHEYLPLGANLIKFYCHRTYFYFLNTYFQFTISNPPLSVEYTTKRGYSIVKWRQFLEKISLILSEYRCLYHLECPHE